MTTILTKKKDTTGAPAPGDLTNSAGGAELAVNTFDKRLYTKDAGGNVVEIGTNPSTIDTTTVDTTNLEVTNIKAKDGTASATIANSTGIFTHSTATVFPAGTVSAPAITTTGDTNTGIFFPAADTIAFTEGGVEAMRIDSSANVGIGTTSPTVRLDVYNSTSVEIAARSDTATVVSSNRYSTDGSAASITCRKYRGTLASPTAVATGDNLGSFNFNAYGGTNLRNVAFIRGFVDSYGSDTNISSYLQFATSPAGSAAATEVMRIDSGGNVGIGVTNPSAYSKLVVLGAVTSGENSSTGGSTLLRGYYSAGSLTNIGTMVSSGGPVIGYGLTGSKSTEYQFLSTTAANLPRTAMYMDGNNFIFYTGAAQTTAIGSTATVTEKMRLDNNGYLGIGTSSPAGFLGRTVSVASGDYGASFVAVSNSSALNWARIDLKNVNNANTTYWLRDQSGNSGIVNEGAQPLYFGTSNTERMRITATGNVGIGTSNPSTKLDIFQNTTWGTASIPALAISITGTGGTVTSPTGTGAITWQGDTTTGPVASIEGVRNNPSSGNAGVLVFKNNTLGASSNTLTETMRIDNSGNLNIGTTSAVGKLNVVGGTGSQVMGYFAATDADYTGLAIKVDPSNSTATISSEWNTGGTSLTFAVGPSEAMRITTSRNISMGTTDTTNAKLTIDTGSSTGTGLLVRGEISGNSDGLVVTYGGAAVANYRVQLAMDAYDGIMRMRNGSNNQTVLITGKSGATTWFGTTGRMLTLGGSAQDIVGGIDFFYSGNGAGSAGLIAFNASGTSNYPLIFRYNTSDVGYITYSNTTVQYVSLSDYRLKENIAPMTGALEKVAKLNPVTYKWKADGSNGQGFIAHELAQVVPDCVSGNKDAVDENGKPKYQGVDTSFLVATLTAAIQEQQAMIEQLTTRLNALEGK